MKAQITRLDDTGRGICLIDNKVTFVPKSVVGDIIDLEITKCKSRYNEGKIIKLIEPSQDRVKHPCPYFNVCGGCDLQNITYENSLKYKIDKVTKIFEKNDINVIPELIENQSPYNYRNKITLKVSNGKVGYYIAKSHDILEIDKCIITNESINKIIPLIKNWNIYNGEIVIRCNQNEEVLIVINTNDDVNIDVDSLKDVCKLNGIVLNDETYYGDNFLYEVINNIVFRISYDSFFQVNPFVASKLFGIVKENIKQSDKVLDLYSGVGTLSLNAALSASDVLGVEIVPNAVLNACFNARINKLDNVNFVLNDATDAVKKIDYDFNKLIVDPPRAGLSKDVINMILNKKPDSIIYVSCDLQTLVRDLNLLKDLYNVKKAYVLDMFSYTYHLETICILELR